jgi:hypothetical protein
VNAEEWMKAMMNDDQIRLPSIIFADIVGYSSLTQKEELSSLELLERLAWRK